MGSTAKSGRSDACAALPPTSVESTERSSPRTIPWPAQLDDVQQAMRWVRANPQTLGVDPDRFGA